MIAAIAGRGPLRLVRSSVDAMGRLAGAARALGGR